MSLALPGLRSLAANHATHLTAADLRNLHGLRNQGSVALNSTTPQKKMHRDLKEKLIRTWQLKSACIIPLVLSTTGIIPNKLHER
jgi:hypothetical protein